MKTINIKEDTLLYISPSDSTDTIYNIVDDAKLTVFDYNINTSKKVEVNLNWEYASVCYHYSCRNINNNTFKIVVNHNKSNTHSELYNHIINTSDNNFTLDVTSIVNKASSKCICNQDNQIINLSNGQGKILPNLLIDNYDVSSSHSAYVGSFKKDIIYYLMSRGISEYNSINLLMQSFLVNGGNREDKIIKEYIGDING